MDSKLSLLFLMIIAFNGVISQTVNSTNAVAETFEDSKNEEGVSVRQFNATTKSKLNCVASVLDNINFDLNSIKWIHENKVIVNLINKYDIVNTKDEKSASSQLIISSVQKSDLGIYVCSFGAISTNVTLFSPPVITFGHKNSRSGMEGDSFNQPCDVSAYPMPLNATWLKENNTIIFDERIKSDGYKLMFTSLEKNDKGLYICSADNQFGNGKAFININVKDKFAALWPFIGIVIEVSILVVIILLYEKKRASKKANQTEEEDGLNVKEKIPDNTQDEADVRQRTVKA